MDFESANTGIYLSRNLANKAFLLFSETLIISQTKS